MKKILLIFIIAVLPLMSSADSEKRSLSNAVKVYNCFKKKAERHPMALQILVHSGQDTLIEGLAVYAIADDSNDIVTNFVLHEFLNNLVQICKEDLKL
jgi:hypothetical protein